MPTQKPESDHPVARLLSEYEKATRDDLAAAESDRARVAAARERITALEADGEARKKRRIELSKAYAEGQATAAELEEGLAAEQRHADTLRAAREGLNAVVKSDSGASARLEAKRRDATARMAPRLREHVTSRLAAMADEVRELASGFLEPVAQVDEGLARELERALPSLHLVSERVRRAVEDVEIQESARRSGPRQFTPGPDGQELPVQERSAADVLREAAERRGRTDATSAGRPVGVVAGRVMQ